VSEIRVQYGAGRTAAAGWSNYDASPTLWLERLPLLGRLVNVNRRRFPREITFGNIVSGLPVAPGSVQAAYASHVLEHLSYEDFWRALHNTFDMLAPGGVFRLIVPDLKARAERYVAGVAGGDPEAATRFLRQTLLGRERRPRTLPQMIRAMLSNAEHLWMWDEPAMTGALTRVGFVDVRRCGQGDSGDPAFAEVEAAHRFRTGAGIIEVAMEARKPLSGSD
jgi:hypothetical protein